MPRSAASERAFSIEDKRLQQGMHQAEQAADKGQALSDTSKIPLVQRGFIEHQKIEADFNTACFLLTPSFTSAPYPCISF
jgi:hypothetical protein